MRYRLLSASAEDLLDKGRANVSAAVDFSSSQHLLDHQIRGAAFTRGPPTLGAENLEPVRRPEIQIKDWGLRGWWAQDAMLVGHRFVVLDRRWLLFNKLSGQEVRTPDPGLDPALSIDPQSQIFVDAPEQSTDYLRGRYVLAFWEPAQMYHHWVFECLTRVVAVLDSASLADVRILIPSDVPPFAIESLALLGIPNERIIFFNPKRTTVIDSLLLMPTPPFELGNCAISALRRLREAVIPGLVSTALDGRKIVFSRRDALVGERLLINEKQVVERLEADGFVTVTPTDFSVLQQMSIAHNASLIACVHGSAGANLLFCKEGGRALHLFPDCVHYFHAHGIGTAVAGARYAYVYGSSFQRGIRYHNNPWLLGPNTVLEAAHALEGAWDADSEQSGA